MFRRSLLGDLAILFEFPRLRTGATSITYGACLDAGNAFVAMITVLDIFAAALLKSMETVAGCIERVS